MARNATATARRRDGYAHDLEVDGHALAADEPESAGGTGVGPSPTRLLAASLAACTAITMEMYADRKGWDVGDVEVEVEMETGEANSVESLDVILHLPRRLSDEQLERLKVIAGKCPVHRALAAETAVEINDRVEPV